MKKMKTIFTKNESNKITSTAEPSALWVFSGEGVPRVKTDGTSCAVIGGELYKRYDCKLITKGKNKGNRKKPPEGFIPCDKTPDPVTNHWPGWAPVLKEDKWHIEAYEMSKFEDGTYELIGPKVQGNIYKLDSHVLIRHNKSNVVELTYPITFDSMKKDLENLQEEGIVFHGHNGEMAKIRRKDFCLKWPI